MQKIFDFFGAADICLQHEAEWFGNVQIEENRDILAAALNVIISEEGSL